MNSAMLEGMKRAAIWLCWGQRYIDEAARSSRSVAPFDRFLICPTDEGAPEGCFTGVRRVERLSSLRDKSRMAEYLPDGYDSFVYLDTDTTVLGDISFGFEKAEQHGIAIAAPAPKVPGFVPVVDDAIRLRADQMQYDTGVIFFRRTTEVLAVFARWAELCATTGANDRDNDQPFFTLAMERLGFLPYVLSPAYNFRGNRGDMLAGGVRIWHNRIAPPSDLNKFSTSWPPRIFRDGRDVKS